MPDKAVDIAVIGAGTAGMAAYRKAREATDNVALIEGGQYGTTCAMVGCMPSKLLIAAAERAGHGSTCAVCRRSTRSRCKRTQATSSWLATPPRVFRCSMRPQMIAPRGEHLAHLLGWAAQSRLDVPTMLDMPFYHPVIEEGVRTALRDLCAQLRLRPAPPPGSINCGPGA